MLFRSAIDSVPGAHSSGESRKYWVVSPDISPSFVVLDAQETRRREKDNKIAKSFLQESFTEHTWSYHLPLVPRIATSKSVSREGTGISNAYTSSFVPSG